jgi:hypothetical protein
MTFGDLSLFPSGSMVVPGGFTVRTKDILKNRTGDRNNKKAAQPRG